MYIYNPEILKVSILRSKVNSVKNPTQVVKTRKMQAKVQIKLGSL